MLSMPAMFMICYYAKHSSLSFDLCVMFSVSATFMIYRKVLNMPLILALVRIFSKFVMIMIPYVYLYPFASLIYFY